MCDNTQHTQNERHGSRLEHGKKAHASDHNKWSRRNFLFTAGLAAAGASLMFGRTNVKAFSPSPLMAALNNTNTDRVLVLIRLKGGNDGLSTIIPLYDYANYQAYRPDIHIPMSEVITLDANAEHGIPNTLAPIHPLWLDGKMKIAHNISYPNQNLSHFRSSDIWASGSDYNEVVSTGWLGRFFEQEYPAYIAAPPSIPPAIQIGSESNLIFRGANSNMSLVINDPNEFYQIAQTGQLYNTQSLPDCYYGSELGFMRTIANSSFRYSETIKAAFDSSTTDAVYPNTGLAEELSIVARLIKGNLGTKVYMVSIGGFDTHSNHYERHGILMTKLAEAISAFYQDISATGHNPNVLMATFSEFGRRIFQNGSMGTDHGEGAPMLFFGDPLNGNDVLGDNPLIHEDYWVGPGNINGDLGIDFRSIYATLLESWLCMDPLVVNAVMGDNYQRINGLVTPCTPVLGSNETVVLLGHQRDLAATSNTLIKYAILVKGTTRMQILNRQGQVVSTVFSEFRDAGSYTISLNPTELGIPSGDYIYQIDTGGKTYSRPLSL